MQYADIVARVQAREGISEQLADIVTRSTVTALAELDPDGAVRRLAQQFPSELTQVVDSSASGQHRSLEEFCARVSELSGVDIYDVRGAVKSVIATLLEAVGEPVIDMFAWLSPDYADLLPAPGRPTADEFFAQVQQTGAIDSRDQAELAVHATLRALADRISAGQAQDLALYLPAEVRADLTGVAEPARRLNRDEFLDRVASIESTDHTTAELHAHAVLTALRDNIPARELADTLEQLPSDIGRLIR